MRGWVPIEWGRRCTPAPLVRLAAAAYDPWNAHFATVLVPSRGTTPPQVIAKAISPDIRSNQRAAGKLELRWPDGSSDLVVWTPRLDAAMDRRHGLDTDAALVHLQRARDGGVLGGMRAAGPFLGREAGGGFEIGSSPAICKIPA